MLKRKPFLIFIIHSSSFLVYEMHFWELPCISIQLFGRIIYFSLILKATLYYSEIATGRHFLLKLCRLFWNGENEIRLQLVAAVGITFIALNLSIPISYFAIQGHLDSKCKAYPTFMTLLSMYATFIVLLIYAIAMYFHGKDTLYIRLEHTLFMCTSVCASVLYLVFKYHFHLKEYHHMTIQFVIFSFYAVYFPFLLILSSGFLNIFKARKKENLIILNKSYDVDTLHSVGLSHLCDENIRFLEAYTCWSYNKSALELDNIIFIFIENHSQYQVNITEELRNCVLNDHRKIELVYDQIIEIVRCNIIPYVDE